MKHFVLSLMPKTKLLNGQPNENEVNKLTLCNTLQYAILLLISFSDEFGKYLHHCGMLPLFEIVSINVASTFASGSIKC